MRAEYRAWLKRSGRLAGETLFFWVDAAGRRWKKAPELCGIQVFESKRGCSIYQIREAGVAVAVADVLGLFVLTTQRELQEGADSLSSWLFFSNLREVVRYCTDADRTSVLLGSLLPGGTRAVLETVRAETLAVVLS